MRKEKSFLFCPLIVLLFLLVACGGGSGGVVVDLLRALIPFMAARSKIMRTLQVPGFGKSRLELRMEQLSLTFLRRVLIQSKILKLLPLVKFILTLSKTSTIMQPLDMIATAIVLGST